MSELTRLFPGSSSAEHENLTYKPGEPLEIDGPSKMVSVTLTVYGIDGGVALVQQIQEVKEGEYDFKLTGNDTSGWPLDSTELQPALAYQVSGHEGATEQSLLVGHLLTEGYEPQLAEEEDAKEEISEEATGDREPGPEKVGDAGSENAGN